MAKSPEEVEKKMAVLGCTGKRVTMDLIKSHIDSVEYETVTINGQKMMFCGIKMDNGFVAVGKPATCIDPSNWRDEIGQQVSYDNSFEELWKLEGYRLMSEGISSTQIAGWGKAEVVGCDHTYGSSFGAMLAMIRDGKKAARIGWNGAGLWLELQNPDAYSKMTLPYIYICYPENAKTTPGCRVPWLASQTDILAEDWVVVE
ncbi:DUF2829 domain-containing protein [Salmonella enterica subsp. salamae]|nr:DUF2829 domain-containing protein [Salmonella enterica subsp. salamae]